MAADQPGTGRVADRSGRILADGLGSERLAAPTDGADVGLAQKGTSEAAIVRRETEI